MAGAEPGSAAPRSAPPAAAPRPADRGTGPALRLVREAGPPAGRQAGPPAGRQPLTGPERLAEFFAPRSIAVVGASEQSGWARYVFAAAAASGFAGDLIPVHHVRPTVFGRRAAASLRDLDSPADLAFILVPTGAVESVLDDAAAAGVRGAVVLASGYRETGEQGRAREERLAARAASLGITLLGPNCLGFINAHARAAAFALTVPVPLAAGPVGVALQSGALASVILNFARSRAIGVSTLASLGNEAMVTASDVISYLADAARPCCAARRCCAERGAGAWRTSGRWPRAFAGSRTRRCRLATRSARLRSTRCGSTGTRSRRSTSWSSRPAGARQCRHEQNGTGTMKLAYSTEQRELRDSVKRFLADRMPLPRVRELMESADGFDEKVWSYAGSQLGLQGIAIGEEYGGAGFSLVEQAIVLEELGAALYPGPYLASAVLAATALLASSDETAKRDLLPGIANGSTVATLAFTEDDGSWEPDAIRLAATGDGEAWRLDGHKSFVLDGHVADLVLAVARTGEGLSLFGIDAATAGNSGGLERRELQALDQTRRLGRLEFSAVPARLIGTPGEGRGILERALDVAAVALAAEQLGGAQRALDMAVEYAKIRHQFGRPIGSFQAIKHRCADLLLEVESLRSAVAYAAAAVAEDSAEVPVVAALVKALASDTYFHVAAENIQIHGGIGFTWEHDAHLYFKRAKSSELFLGDASYHRERLATRIGI